MYETLLASIQSTICWYIQPNERKQNSRLFKRAVRSFLLSAALCTSWLYAIKRQRLANTTKASTQSAQLHTVEKPCRIRGLSIGRNNQPS